MAFCYVPRRTLSQKIFQRATETELLAFRETSTKEKREMSKNLDVLTNENIHLRKELEMLIEQNKGSTNQVEEYTEKITGLEVTKNLPVTIKIGFLSGIYFEK